jgi:hypothetical protein
MSARTSRMHREQMYKSCRRELEKMREDNALLRAEVINAVMRERLLCCGNGA